MKQTHLVIRQFVNLKQLGLALGVLGIGLVQYVFSRPADSTHIGHFLQAMGISLPAHKGYFGAIGHFLPAFVHPFALSLMITALFPKSEKKFQATVCCFWMVTNLLFEVGQYLGGVFQGATTQILTAIIPHAGLSSLLVGYFINGTFDILDIIAICAGAWTAYAVGLKTNVKDEGGIKYGTLHSSPRTKLDKKNVFRFGWASS